MTNQKPDFTKLTRDFSSNIRQSNAEKILSYFPQVEIFLDEYLNNYSLLSPNEGKTNEFLYKFIPEVSLKLLQLSYLKDNQIDSVLNFLNRILFLIVFQIEQCDFKLNKTMKRIFNSTEKLYRYPKNQQFQILCQLFVSFDGYKRLLDRCRYLSPNIKNLSIIFSIRKRINDYLAIEFDQILAVLPDFISKFQGDTIRSIDNYRIKRIFVKYIAPNIDTSTSTSTSTQKVDFLPLFKFSEILIKCSYLDKQLFGLEIISVYINKIKNKVDNNFIDWIKNSCLIDYILSNEGSFNIEFIKALNTFFQYISESKMVNDEVIEKMYLNTTSINKAERTQIHLYIIMLLYNFNDELKTMDFIDKHKVDSDFLHSLILVKYNSSKNKVIQKCIQYLIKNSSTNEVVSILKLNSTNIRSTVLAESMNICSCTDLNFLSDILSKLLETSKNFSTEFGESTQFVPKVLEGFQINNLFVFIVLKKYYIISKKSLDINVLIVIADNKSDLFWDFLTSIIKANKFKALTRDSLENLYQICQSFYNSEDEIKDGNEPTKIKLNEEFILCLKYILILLFESNKLLSKSSIEEFKLHHLPKNYLKLLYCIFFKAQSKKEKALVKDLLIDIFTRIKKSSYPTMEVYQILSTEFIPKLENDKFDKVHILSFIYSLITIVEKDEFLEDYGKRRHSELIEDNQLLLTIEFITDPPNPKAPKQKNITIHVGKNIDCNKFVKRIRKITSNNNSKVFFNTLLIQGDFPIVNSSINENSVISVTNYQSGNKKKMLSILLSNPVNKIDKDKKSLTFHEKLYSMLKNSSSNQIELIEIIWNLLQFLPSIENFVFFDLNSCENDYVLAYYLQILNTYSGSNYNENILFEIFNKRLFEKSDFAVIRSIYLHFNEKTTPKYISDSIKTLFLCINKYQIKDENDYNCNSFNESYIMNSFSSVFQTHTHTNKREVSNQAILLLSKMIKDYNKKCTILGNYIHEIVEMCINIRRNVGKEIFLIVDKVEDKLALFSSFLEKFQVEVKNFDLIFRLFIILWKQVKVNNHIPAKLLLEKCTYMASFSSVNTKFLFKIVLKIVNMKINNIGIECSSSLSHSSRQNDEETTQIINETKIFFNKIIKNRLYIKDEKEVSEQLQNFIKKIKKIEKPKETNIILSIIEQNFTEIFMYHNIHFNMSTKKYEKTDFVGLQNLGNTCFINSVIQVLFYSYSFRYSILETSDKILNKLFIDMMITEKGFLKPKKFVEQFNNSIDTSRQQDCVEFFLILLDKIDIKCQKFFKGIFSNYLTDNSVKDYNNKYTSGSNSEDFMALTASVKDYTNLNDSLKSFFDEIIIGNLAKQIKIKKNPPILVIQLKRFEYNLKTYERTKINSQFSFPFDLDVSPFIENESNNKNQNGKYDLFGVVLHSGQAEGGHYTSLIKMENIWILFNDKKSSKINTNDFPGLCFGSNDPKNRSNSNAYLLFYKERNDAINEKYDFSRFTNERERTEHLCLYEDALKNFVFTETNSSKMMISFYFNVYCHSNFSDSREIVTKIISKLDSDNQNGKELFDFLLEKEIGKNNETGYGSQLIEIFIRSKSESILLGIRRLILKFSANKSCFVLLDMLIDKLNLFFYDKPEKIDSLALLYFDYLLQGNIKKPIRHKWCEKLISFINNFAEKVTLENTIKKIRLSDIINSIKLLITSDLIDISGMTKTIYSIENNFKFLLSNPFNSFALFDLYNECNKKALSITTTASSSSSSSSTESKLDLMNQLMKKLKSEPMIYINFIIGMIECAIDKEIIFPIFKEATKTIECAPYFREYITKMNSEICCLCEFLIINYEEFVLPDLLSVKSETRNRAELLTYDMFMETRPPKNINQISNSRKTQKNDIISENLKQFASIYIGLIEIAISKIDIKSNNNNSTKYNSTILENFLRIMKWIIKKCYKKMVSNEILSKLLNIFSVVNRCNIGNVPDKNYFIIIEVLSILNFDGKNESEYANEIEKVIISSLKFGSIKQFCKLIFPILSNLDKSLIIKIYSNPKFVDFFMKEVSLRQDIHYFDEIYENSLKKIINEDKEIFDICVNSILLKSPTIEVELPLLTFLIKYSFDKLPNEVIIISFKYVIGSILNDQDYKDYDIQVIILTRSLESSKKKDDFPFNEICLYSNNNSKESDFIKSIEKINVRSKMKSEPISNYVKLILLLCTKSYENKAENIIEMVLQKLLEIISFIDERRKKEYTTQMKLFFDIIERCPYYDSFIDRFVEAIFPLLAIGQWQETYFFEFLYNCCKLSSTFWKKSVVLQENVSLIFRYIVVQLDLTDRHQSNYSKLIDLYLKIVSLDVLTKSLEELANDKSNLKIVSDNVKKIVLKKRKDIPNLIKELFE